MLVKLPVSRIGQVRLKKQMPPKYWQQCLLPVEVTLHCNLVPHLHINTSFHDHHNMGKWVEKQIGNYKPPSGWGTWHFCSLGLLDKANYMTVSNLKGQGCVVLLCAQRGQDTEILQTRSHVYQVPFNCLYLFLLKLGLLSRDLTISCLRVIPCLQELWEPSGSRVGGAYRFQHSLQVNRQIGRQISIYIFAKYYF